MLIKFAIRNLKKRFFFNLIKILGLSFALGGILFIVLFIQNELSYDKFHPNASRIYRFTAVNPDFIGGKHFARTHNVSFIPEMAAYFPEVENYVRLAPARGGVIKHFERFYNVSQAFECDSTFFQIFDADLIIGDRRNVLDAPGSMVITESFAKKIFGDANPVGEAITPH